MKNLLFILLSFTVFLSSCGVEETKSSSGVSKAKVKIDTDNNGNTIEQRNVIERLKRDNEIGSIKHLYLISPISGQVLLYSTVKGKVTSGNKRLTPSTVAINGYSGVQTGMIVDINGYNFLTEEVLGDDGTYGSSSEYIYWFDIRDVFHQQFITSGSVVIHVSDQPITVKNIVINIEETEKKDKK